MSLFEGTGGSGKSTIFKQLQIIHKNAYTPEECKQYVDLIYKNTLQAIRTLIEQAPKFNNEIQKEVVKVKIFSKFVTNLFDNRKGLNKCYKFLNKIFNKKLNNS